MNNAYLDAAKNGLNTNLRNKPIYQLAKNFIAIAKKGLDNRAIVNKQNKNESIFLNEIESMINNQETPASILIKKFNGNWKENINKIFDEEAF